MAKYRAAKRIPLRALTCASENFDIDREEKIDLAYLLIKELPTPAIEKIFNIVVLDPRKWNGDLDKNERLRDLHESLVQDRAALYSAEIVIPD